MAIEMLMGVQVINEDAYIQYRKEMLPILEGHGGAFGYDFKIQEVLKSETENPINRVFTIHFKDQKAKDTFFSNQDYLTIKEKHFQRAVSVSTKIAEYEKN